MIMKRVILAIAVACAALLVGASVARAFVGGSGSGTDFSTAAPAGVVPPGAGVCSVSGAPCGFVGAAPCPFVGGVGAAPETCLLPNYASTLTFTQDGTSGESSAVLSGFYECKQKSKTPAVKTSEDTLLVLINGQVPALCACVVLYDGHETQLFAGLTDLKNSLGVDVDEINLCSLAGTIPAGGFTGSVQVVTYSGACSALGSTQGGAYGWIKDVAYTGKKKDPVNPFSASVRGVGKTELRVTPAGVLDGSGYLSICGAASLIPQSAYAENTYE
jgi:hypothetical protein